MFRKTMWVKNARSMLLGALLAKMFGWLGWRQRPCIIIVKPGSIGDLILFSGFLSAVQARHPEKDLVLVASHRAEPALSVSGVTLKIIFLSDRDEGLLKNSIHKISFIWRWAQALMTAEAVWVHTLQRAQLLEDIKHAVVFSGVKDFKWVALSDGAEALHIMDSIAEFARLVFEDQQVMLSDVEPKIILSQDCLARASSIISLLKNADSSRKVIVIFPGARFKIKEWHSSGFGEVIQRISKTHKVACIILGAGDVLSKAEIIYDSLQEAGVECINLCGKSKFMDSVAVISQSDLYLGSDTFAAHVATILKVPSVVVMWAGASAAWGPWRDQGIHEVVSVSCERSPLCEGKCENPKGACIKRISTNMVLDALERLLQKDRPI